MGFPPVGRHTDTIFQSPHPDKTRPVHPAHSSPNFLRGLLPVRCFCPLLDFHQSVLGVMTLASLLVSVSEAHNFNLFSDFCQPLTSPTVSFAKQTPVSFESVHA